MTKNTGNETERMVVTRIFDAPRELVWKAWTDPKNVAYALSNRRNKKSGFFTKENQAEIVINLTVQSDPQASKTLSFPLSVTANTQDYGNSGQVSLPIEYPLVSGLSLKQVVANSTVLYTGFSLDTTLANLKSANGLGSAISALSTIAGSGKLPIPSNPYSQAATYLFGFAGTAIQNDITAKNAADKYSTATLQLNFSENSTCDGGPAGAGFDTTGTKALLMEQGNSADPGYVPIDKTTDYCWQADTTPTRRDVLLAVRESDFPREGIEQCE